jgi:cellulose synthase/poly-beta-1,6-N-acetylglucosamine synthase-like glycosyltransferase
MVEVFWVSTVVIGYIYVGYSVLLAAWARLVPRPVLKASLESTRAAPPSISIVLAVRNEAARVPARIINLLELDYPGRREIIVVSDGSTDGTADAIRSFFGVNHDSGSMTRLTTTPADIRVIEVPAGGKPAALNAGVAAASGELLVFADARQRFSPDTLLHLAANFADPRVGGVNGELRLDCEAPAGADSSISEGVGLYWKYEKWMRRQESAVWSTLGATGAIYALRRRLWTPLPADTLLDDVLAPMRAVLAGHRIVFEENAIAYDQTSPDAAAESRRKVRTLAGNYQILWHEPRLLLPFANPVWLQYLSHKVGRLIVPWALVAVFAASAVLAASHWLYATAFVGQLAFYALAAFGGWLDAHHQPALAPAGVRTQPRGSAHHATEPLGKGARS